MRLLTCNSSGDVDPASAALSALRAAGHARIVSIFGDRAAYLAGQIADSRAFAEDPAAGGVDMSALEPFGAVSGLRVAYAVGGGFERGAEERDAALARPVVAASTSVLLALDGSRGRLDAAAWAPLAGVAARALREPAPAPSSPGSGPSRPAAPLGSLRVVLCGWPGDAPAPETLFGPDSSPVLLRAFSPVSVHCAGDLAPLRRALAEDLAAPSTPPGSLAAARGSGPLLAALLAELASEGAGGLGAALRAAADGAARWAIEEAVGRHMTPSAAAPAGAPLSPAAAEAKARLRCQEAAAALAQEARAPRPARPRPRAPEPAPQIGPLLEGFDDGHLAQRCALRLAAASDGYRRREAAAAARRVAEAAAPVAEAAEAAARAAARALEAASFGGEAGPLRLQRTVEVGSGRAAALVRLPVADRDAARAAARPVVAAAIAAAFAARPDADCPAVSDALVERQQALLDILVPPLEAASERAVAAGLKSLDAALGRVKAALAVAEREIGGRLPLQAESLRRALERAPGTEFPAPEAVPPVPALARRLEECRAEAAAARAEVARRLAGASEGRAREALPRGGPPRRPRAPADLDAARADLDRACAVSVRGDAERRAAQQRARREREAAAERARAEAEGRERAQQEAEEEEARLERQLEMIRMSPRVPYGGLNYASGVGKPFDPVAPSPPASARSLGSIGMRRLSAPAVVVSGPSPYSSSPTNANRAPAPGPVAAGVAVYSPDKMASPRAVPVKAPGGDPASAFRAVAPLLRFH
eukprot:tig00021489_g21695.t1